MLAREEPIVRQVMEGTNTTTCTKEEQHRIVRDVRQMLAVESAVAAPLSNSVTVTMRRLLVIVAATARLNGEVTSSTGRWSDGCPTLLPTASSGVPHFNTTLRRRRRRRRR